MEKDIPLSYKRALKYLGFTGEPTAEQICMLESTFNNVTKTMGLPHFLRA